MAVVALVVRRFVPNTMHEENRNPRIHEIIPNRKFRLLPASLNRKNTPTTIRTEKMLLFTGASTPFVFNIA